MKILFFQTAIRKSMLALSACFLLMNNQKLLATDLYWIGGTSDYYVAGNWSYTSGGPSCGCAPTQDDNVFFDANSFTSPNQYVWLNNAIAICKNMDWTGVQNYPTFSGGWPLYCYGSFKLDSNMYTGFSFGSIDFRSDSSGNTIDFAGHAYDGTYFTFEGNGEWTLTSDLVINRYMYLNKGTLNTNGKNVTTQIFLSNTTNNRTLNLGASVFTLAPVGDYTYHWDMNPLNMTLNAGTSLITSNNYIKFNGGGLIYNDISNTGSTLIIYGANTFRNITTDYDLTVMDNIVFTKGDLNNNATFYNSVTMDSLVLFPGKQYNFATTTHTLNNYFQAEGTCSLPIKINSTGSPNQAIINSASATSSMNYVWFKDMKITGGANLIANNSIDFGNTSGFDILNPPVQDLYWVGGTGNWSDASHWALSSGGPGGTCIPTAFDNVFFDANSFSAPSQIVTVNNYSYCRNMTWMGVTNTPIFDGGYDLSIYGSVTMSPDMTMNFSGWWLFQGDLVNNITMNGKNIVTVAEFDGNGTWNFMDSIGIGMQIYFKKGTINTNNNPVTCGFFYSTTTEKRNLNLGSSNIVVFGSGGMVPEWEIVPDNFSLTAGTSQIILSDNSFNPLEFIGGNLAYNDVSFTGSVSSCILKGNNTYNNISISGTGTLEGNNIFNDAVFEKTVTIKGDNLGRNVIFNGYVYTLANNTFKTVTANGDLNIVTGSNTIQKLTINKTANISTNNRYDSLYLGKNSYNIFGAGVTQIINNLFSTGATCNESVTIVSGTAGSQTNFVKTSGSVTLNNIRMKDVNASGGAVFTANNVVDFGNNSGWNMNNNAGRDLYWVSNSGNWRDSSHWATTSGGAGGNCIPTQYDNVYFDANSFTEVSSVNIDSSAFCKNMDWTGSGFNSSPAGSGNLNMYGSFTMNYDFTPIYTGNIYFKGENGNYQIKSNGYKIQLNSNKRVEFDGKNSNWNLMDEFYTSGSVYVTAGAINTNNLNATFGSLTSENNNLRSIYLGTSNLTVLGNSNGIEPVAWKLSGSNFNFDGDSATINFTNSSDIHFYGGDLIYKALTFANISGIGYVHGNNAIATVDFNVEGNIDGNNLISGNVNFTGDGTISGNNIINLSNFTGNGTFSGDNQFDTLNFSAGNTYSFSPGSTQTLTGYLNATGTSNAYINIESSAACNAAYIKKNGDSIHVEYVRIKDVETTGTALFKAYNSLNQQNGSGWNLQDNGARNLHWIGDGGNWSDPLHWSLSSGGPSCGCVPDGDDNVFFDANSFTGSNTVTLDINAYCRNMDWTGVTVFPSLGGSKDLYISGSLTLNSSVSYTVSGNLHFIGTLTTNTITTAGRNLTSSFSNGVYFECGGGQWLLMDDFIISGYIHLVNATLNTNGKNVQARGFISDSQQPRKLIMGSSTITINNYTNYNGTWVTWYVMGSGFTCEPGTSLIRCTYPWVSGFQGGNATYYNLDFVGGSNYGFVMDNNLFNDVNFNGEGLVVGNNIFRNVVCYKKATISGDNNFNILDLRGEGIFSGNYQLDTMILGGWQKYQFGAGNNYTFTGDIINSGACNTLNNLKSNATGTAANFIKSSGTLDIEYAQLMDIITSGGAIFNADNCVNTGNTSGWNFTNATPRDLYWVGGTGYWSDASHWASTSGGAGGACIPSINDNVFFDANSFTSTSQTVIYDEPAFCKTMDWTGAPYTPGMQGSAELHIYGSLILNANMTLTLSENIYMNSPNAGNLITSNGIAINFTGTEDNFVIEGNGSWTLTDDFSSANIFILDKGTLNTNNKKFSCLAFLSNGTESRGLVLSASEITVTGKATDGSTGYSWWLESTGLSFSGNLSLINLTDSDTIRFFGASQSYKNVNYMNSNSIGIIYDDNNFYDVNFYGEGAMYGDNDFHNVWFAKKGLSDGNSNFNNVLADANLTLSSGTNTFNILEIKGNGIFSSINTMDTLLLSTDKKYEFANNKTQTINGYLYASGNCKQYVTLTSDVSGVQATLSRPGGTSTVSYCKIKGINATGASIFTGDNSIDLGNNTNWNFTNGAVARDLYWIGSSGSWNDTLHWSLTSGGAGGECLPTAKDNVFFDDNSFIAGVQYVLIDQDANCHDMTWVGSTYNTSILGKNPISIYGNLSFNGNVKNNLESNYLFTATDTGKTITTSGQVFRESVYMDGTGGSWKLMDAFTTSKDILFINGTLNTNNKNLTASAFNSNYSTSRGLIAGSSDILLTGSSDYQGTCLSSPWNINPSGFNFQAGSSTLHFVNNMNHCFNGTGLNYYNVDFENGKYTAYLSGNSNYHNVNFFGACDLSGTNTFNKVTSYGNYNVTGATNTHILTLKKGGYFNANTSIDTLHLSPGMNYYFGSGKTQTINQYLSATGVAGNLLSLQSSVPGNFSSLSKSSGLVCLDYVKLKDMTGTGGAGFYAGANSQDIGNNSGWSFSPCSFTTFFTKKDIDCNGNNNGAVKIFADGGVFPYSYSWSTGSTLDTLSNLASDTYYVTVTDAMAQTLIDSVMIVEPVTLGVTLNGTTPACNGEQNGSIQAVVTGGVSPYTYLWNTLPPQTSATTTGLGAGNYRITITDTNSCSLIDSLNLSEPTVLSVTLSVTEPNCNLSSDGTITSNPSGGTSPYTYVWSDAQTTSTVSTLVAGSYTITVSDNKGCSTSSSATLAEPAAIILSTSSVNSTCGNLDGSASVIITSGGIAPFSYAWNTGATTSNLSGVPSGAYTVTVTDVNGCTSTASANVSDIGGPTINLVGIINPDCAGGASGSIEVSASGGTAPYSYLWSTGDNIALISGLTAGDYFVTLTDNNGCQAVSNYTVTDGVTISLSISGTDPACNGGNSGSATATASGGTSPYNYIWTGGQSSQTANNLLAGTYIVTVTDSKTCTQSNDIILTNPSVLSVSASGTNPVCIGSTNGSATATPSGGTSPYSYVWSGGQATGTVSGLSSGTWTVTVSDSKSCTSSGTVTLNDPAGMSLTTSSTQSTCGNMDGSATVSVSGGASPYIYNWSSGANTATAINLASGNYTVTTTDNNGCTSTAIASVSDAGGPTATIAGTNPSCNGGSNGSATVTPSGGVSPYTLNWSSGGATATVSGMTAGTFNVTVTDANLCNFNTSVTLIEPTAISLLATGNNPTCNASNDGSANVSATGGTSPFTYMWNSGETTSTVSGKISGTYTVTVTDSKGCTASASATIADPIAISLTTSSTQSTCGNIDGTASASVSGGASPYSYQWSSGATTSTITGISSGSYTVTVTDNNGCTAMATESITDAGGPTATIAGTNISCNGESTGSATITPSGGQSPYTFIWTGGQTSSVATGLSPGTFNVTVIDNKGCNFNTSVTLTEPGLLQTIVTVNNASCNNTQDGNISLSTNGGISPYSYNWSNGATAAINANLGAGNYSVTLTDNNGCLLNQENISVAFLEVPPVSAFGYSLSERTVTFVDSSSGATNYLWTFGDGGTDVVASPAYTYSADGNYTVILQVSNSCGVDSVIKVITIDATKLIEKINNPDGKFVIYPVPADDKIFIYTDKLELFGEIILMNVQGVKVASYKRNTTTHSVNEKTFEIQLKELPVGSYFIKIKRTDGREQERLITVVR